MKKLRNLSWTCSCSLWSFVYLTCIITTCDAQDGVQVEGDVVAKILIGIFGAIASGLVAAILVSLALVIFRLNYGPVGVSKKKPLRQEVRSSASKAIHMDGKETRFVSVYSNPSSGTASVIGTPSETSSNLLLSGGRYPSSSPVHPPTRPPPTVPVPQTRHQSDAIRAGIRVETRARPTAPLYPSLGHQIPIQSYGLQPGVHHPHRPRYLVNRDRPRPMTLPGRPVAYLNRIDEERSPIFSHATGPVFPPPPSVRPHHPQFQHSRFYPTLSNWY